MPPHAKGSTITDPAILEKLRIARIKALEVRKANAVIRKDAKLVVELETRQANEIVSNKLKNIVNKVNETKTEPDSDPDPPPVQNVRKKKPPVVYVEPDSSSDEEIIVKKPKDRAKKKKIVYVESNSSSDEEIIVKQKRRPLTTPAPSPVPVHDPIGDLYRRNYG